MAHWALYDGAMKTISVGDSSNIWALDSKGNIYKKNNKTFGYGTDKFWIPIDGLPEDLEIGDVSVGACGHVLVSTKEGVLFRRDMEDDKWHQFKSGFLLKVSVADNSNIVGIGLKNQRSLYPALLYSYECNFIDLHSSDYLGSSVTDIAVGSDGQIFTIGATQNKVYRYLKPIHRTDENPYRDITGNLEEGALSISLANESMLMAIGGDNNIYRYVGEFLWEKIEFNDMHNNRISGTLQSISTGSDGHMIVVVDDQGTYRNYGYIPFSINNPKR